MIGYVTLGTNDLKKSAAFYDKIAAEMAAKLDAVALDRTIELGAQLAWGS